MKELLDWVSRGHRRVLIDNGQVEAAITFEWWTPSEMQGFLRFTISRENLTTAIEAAIKWANKEDVVGIEPNMPRATASESQKRRAEERLKAATSRSED